MAFNYQINHFPGVLCLTTEDAYLSLAASVVQLTRRRSMILRSSGLGSSLEGYQGGGGGGGGGGVGGRGGGGGGRRRRRRRRRRRTSSSVFVVIGGGGVG